MENNIPEQQVMYRRLVVEPREIPELDSEHKSRSGLFQNYRAWTPW